MEIKQLILQTSTIKKLTELYETVMELPVRLRRDAEITIWVGSTGLVFQQVSTADPFYHLYPLSSHQNFSDRKNFRKRRIEEINI
jgi:catechol-2,3-dioxygenase